MILIREYNPSDINVLAELMGDLGYPTSLGDMSRRMSNIESNPYCFTFVATWKEQVVGMIGVRLLINYEIDDSVTQISALVVNKEYQGRGIGKSLLNFIEEWSRSKGSNILYLTSGTKEERKPAHEFYKEMGFELTGYRFIKNLENKQNHD